MTTLTLTAGQCERLLRPAAVVAALAHAHRELAEGGAAQPLPVPMRRPGASAPDAPAYVPMAAYAPYLGTVAVKLLADAPANRALGLPAQRSTVGLFSAETAECLALVDGRVLTRVRTAAMTALATRTLSTWTRPTPGAGAGAGGRVLGLAGAGALAVEHVRAHCALPDVRPDTVVVWSRSAASQERFRAAVAGLEGADRLEVVTVPQVREVFEAADVVCTLTPAQDPIVAGKHLRPGQHLSAVGSPPRPGYQELDPDVFAAVDRVFVDDRPIAEHESGNIRAGLEAGTLTAASLTTLGDVLTGTAPGRTDAREVTLFNSVGIGLQDLATLHHLLSEARAEGVGAEFDLRA